MHSQPRNQLFETDDPVAVIVEGVLRSLWVVVLAVVALLRIAIRAPVVAAAATCALATFWFIGWRPAVALVGVIAVALGAWRVVDRQSFRRLGGPVLGSVWRAPLYRLWFPHVAGRCGLVVYEGSGYVGERRNQEAARLLRVQIKGTGVERLLVRLPVGLTPEDVAARAQAVGHAFGVREARVLADRPGRVWIELRRRDLLTDTVRLTRPGTFDLQALPIGLGDDGRPWCLRVQGTHTLVAGATGAGKGSVLWSMVAALAPAIETHLVEVWAVDPKGGMELGLGRQAFARFEGGPPEAMCALLESLVELKSRRSLALSTHGLRRHVPNPESPHIILVVDELATVTAFAERAISRRVDQALGLLLTQGRAVGISVVAAVQDPGKDVVTWRDLFPTRIAMRLDNPIQVDMVLGDGARDRGARADQISELQPGIAYVRVEGTRGIKRVRSAYLTDDEVQEVAARVAAARQRTIDTTEEAAA